MYSLANTSIRNAVIAASLFVFINTLSLCPKRRKPDAAYVAATLFEDGAPLRLDPNLDRPSQAPFHHQYRNNLCIVFPVKQYVSVISETPFTCVSPHDGVVSRRKTCIDGY